MALGRWVRDRLPRVRRGLGYLGFGMLTAMASLLLIGLAPILAVAWLIAPEAAHRLRRWTDRERERVARFTGEPVPSGQVITDGTVRDRWWSIRRDVAWVVLHGLTGHVLGMAALMLPLSALNAVAVPAYWWALPADDPVSSPYPVTSWGLAATMPVMAVGYAALALLVTPWLAEWRARMARRVLAPPPGSRLVERVAELTASRAAALEAHGAELRRIERDLHDDTQNRIVAVAMHLGIVERALRRDPAAALPMVLRAQDAASDALAGLRDVVRSIYPPVLAERGLDGAVAGLIARCPVPCTLSADGLRRAPAAVESAAYFVVAEALTNIAKHSGAEHAAVSLSRPGNLLVIEVTDDGHGGADEAGGTGLAGIRRRVSAFDGTTLITSPDGGPTVLRVELPCGS
jgi:signal transduction histidine kinase